MSSAPVSDPTSAKVPAQSPQKSSTVVELPLRMPKHVGIIMDGNGRWAKNRGFHRSIGHVKGTSIVKDIISEAKDIGIQVLTLYCFSTENWSRPNEEISVLMDLLGSYLMQERDELFRGNIRFKALGQIDRLPGNILDIVNDTIHHTAKNTGMLLNFCVSYGGRQELIRAIKMIAEDLESGLITKENINEELINSKLYTSGLADPDLIIRTSGEFRSSNFLLWQSAYSEYYITDVLWPDFTREELHKALAAYGLRKRRFGFSDESLAAVQQRQAAILTSFPSKDVANDPSSNKT